MSTDDTNADEVFGTQGYKRLAQGVVQGPMPALGNAIRTSDDLWKSIAWIRSINPPPIRLILPQPDSLHRLETNNLTD
jgi:hypothetical protein